MYAIMEVVECISLKNGKIQRNMVVEGNNSKNHVDATMLMYKLRLENHFLKQNKYMILLQERRK